MPRKLAEWSLIFIGLLFLGFSARSYFHYQAFQKRGLALPSTPRSAVTQSIDKHPVIGRLSVSRLGFSVVVVEGDDEESLELAAGHMPGTAQAGHVGNMVIAGHRDTAFWPLRQLKNGDEIQVRMDQTATYRVREMSIVDPSDVRSLQDTKDAMLTLVTCYPFRHVGPAPRRFIVRAMLVGHA